MYIYSLEPAQGKKGVVPSIQTWYCLQDNSHKTKFGTNPLLSSFYKTLCSCFMGTVKSFMANLRMLFCEMHIS